MSSDDTWICLRCQQKFNAHIDYYEERDFILCFNCKTNTTIKRGEYRWALILWHWYQNCWNIEIKLPSFWPTDNHENKLTPEKFVHIVLPLKTINPKEKP